MFAVAYRAYACKTHRGRSSIPLTVDISSDQGLLREFKPKDVPYASRQT
jgi:hypothetical protein